MSQWVCAPPQVCGYEYTYRLQRMFTDMDVSADLNKVGDPLPSALSPPRPQPSPPLSRP